MSDTIPPVAACQNLSLYLDTGGSTILNPLQLDGGSTDNLAVTSLSASVSGFGCGDLGANTVVLTVYDGAGNSDTCTATVTVWDTLSPTATCMAIDTLYLDTAGTVILSEGMVDGGSTDNCGIAALALSDSVFTCADTGQQVVRLLVGDGSGNVDSCAIVTYVKDTIKPVVNCQNITVNLDIFGYAFIGPNDVATFSDNCGIQYVNLYQDAFNCFDAGTYPGNSLFVRDVNDNYQQCFFTVNVVDPYNPIPVCQNINVNIDATGYATFTPWDVLSTIYQSNCYFNVYLSHNGFGCGDLGPQQVTLTVVEVSGSTGSCQATVNVIDPEPPVAVCQEVTLAVNGVGYVTASAYNVGMNSTDNCGYISSWQLSPSNFNCGNLGANTAILTVYDDYQNTDTCHANVTIVDIIPPIGQCQSIVVLLDTSGTAAIYPADLDAGSTDNCGQLNLSLSDSLFGCNQLGPNVIQLFVQDNSGNADTCLAMVTVLDTTPPALSCAADTVYLDSSGVAFILPIDVLGHVFDPCGIAYLDVQPDSFAGVDVGVNMVILSASDSSGNVSGCTAQVTVLDTNSIGTALEGRGGELSVELFPNPTTGDLTVRLDALASGMGGTYEVRLTDLVGHVLAVRTMDLQAGTNTVRFDLADYALGFYLITVDAEGTRLTRRVVKQ